MRRLIYGILLILAFLLAVDIWFVTNVLQSRGVGYLIWQGMLTIILLFIGMVITFAYEPKKKFNRGILLFYALLVFEALVMINYSSLASEIEKLQFYFLVAMSSSAFLIISMVGNVARVEKKQEQGFHMPIHDDDSPITLYMMVPLWIIIFFVMGFFVSAMGHVLVSYPQFGIADHLGSPAVSGFGVGDWENILFIFFGFSVTMFLLSSFGIPDFVSRTTSVIIAGMIFVAYHSLVYTANTQAIIVVAMFGLICAGLYAWTRSMLLPSAIHIGNNFFGALYQKTVFGTSAFGGTEGNFIASIVILSIMAVMSYVIVKKFGKKKGRASKGGKR